MQDKTLFDVDNYIMLPAWVQVFLHRCKLEEVIQLATRLSQSKQNIPAV